MKDFAYQRLPARLALRFLDLSNCDCSVYDPSQQALADMLGTYRETIGALLRRFRDAELLKSGHDRIELRDATGLRVRTSDLPIPPDGLVAGAADDEGIRR